MQRQIRIGVCVFLAVMAMPLLAAEPQRPQPDATNTQSTYNKRIKPLLTARCYACHGALKQEAGLRLDSGQSILDGSENGPVLSPGTAGGLLIDRVSSADPTRRMPPEGELLTAEEIALINRWIEDGASFPDDDQPQADPKRHWSFQTPKRPAIPNLTGTELAKHPIDAFVIEQHQQRLLASAPPAPKAVLLRRVYLDLIGLPPSRLDLHEFSTDESPDALEKVVDRLLASPPYGERWGRHWMDVWRYADWYGRRYVPDVWNSAPQIWRWRDWIVKSLNADKSYARMVAEMLAGDEIAPEDDEAGYATGYLIRNWYALNPNDWMRSNVEHTGKAFLGLTFNCAHCHDHKYDPITQIDYFRLRAFFEPISIRQDRVAGEPDPGPFQEYDYSVLRKVNRLGGVRIFDKTPEAMTWFYTGGDERNRVTERGTIAPGLPEFLSDDSFKITSVSLPPQAWYPGSRPAIQQSVLAEQRSALSTAESQLPETCRTVEAALPTLKQQLAQVEQEFADARQALSITGTNLALTGQQSLLMDASTGRRVVQHRLLQLKSLGDTTAIRFQMQLLKDAHVNFQLAKDFTKGLTAAYIGFDQGRIMSYQPGSFTEFEVGRYNVAGGQNRFEVTLDLRSMDDVGLLSVKSTSDNQLLVDHISVARNGWNPTTNADQGITLDVRTGAVAAFDQWQLIARTTATADGTANATPSSDVCVSFDFESPRYNEFRDVIGIDGWFGSQFSAAGAKSFVTAIVGQDSLHSLASKLNQARRAVDAQQLKQKSLESRISALQASLRSTQARIDADRVRHETAPRADADEFARTASRLHHDATRLTAFADLLTKDQVFAAAEAKPLDDVNRAKEVEAAEKQWQAAVDAHYRADTARFETAQDYPSFSPIYPKTSTGRRRALAEWITGRNNPLTARVAVNHVWLRHFQSPLVATVADFGVNGSPPTHPELLDWLAVEFMESDWSMKRLHRAIVTSRTYGKSSGATAGNEHEKDVDPENRSLWRANLGRMESEVVRDSLMHTAGLLDMKLGGQELENSLALTTWRRTLYYSCQPEIDGKSTFGALFDAPEPADCYRRTRSIIPQQALALTNSDLVQQISTQLATQLWDQLSTQQQATSTDFITAAYEHILTRQPTKQERLACLQFLSPTDDGQTDPVRSRENLVRVLLNHNDFVAIR